MENIRLRRFLGPLTLLTSLAGGCGARPPTAVATRDMATMPPGSTADLAVPSPDDMAASSLPIDLAAPSSWDDLAGPTSEDAGTTALDVRGVYLVTTPQSVADGTTQSGIALAGVDGILVNAAWNQVQSDTGVYDFSQINSEAQLAVSAGLKFEIALKAGGFIPLGWVVGQKGAVEIDVPFAPKGGATTCDLEKMALPWDANYLAALDDLLANLAQDLKDQALYSHLTMVRITTINGQSDELRLPAQAATVASCLTNAGGDTPISLWSKAGYKPSLLLGGWSTALQSYKSHFPDKVLNIAVIQQGSLPPIDDAGTVYTGTSAQTQIAGQVANLISAAATALPGQLAIQWNGVSDQATDPDPPSWAVTYDERFGWQSNEWGGESTGAECGPDAADSIACTHTTLQTLLDNGIHPVADMTVRASYFELFAPNFIIYPGLAAYAHNQIFAP